ncbi:hypothetical protein EPUS_04844 [Endocarpon pusillum Z07020]|uniref:Uncharacterized protein n=1 Tax=Endocarpon pusillum (strain Z07020 / HMAS-L-300199) TaxID=1263415 RepID=U1GBX5_ENDPU|nr:uncharacterized protein EPUS_04844 [Endocarpon pusillum Z07020]ERF75062.1 hypothetical protein EPUS_04844 [Endocarpon pusillum Z07020]
MDQSGHVSKKRELHESTPELSDGLSDFNEAGLVDLLENDPRPTFLIDFGGHGSLSGTGAHFVYCNDSLRSNASIWEQVQSLYSPATASHDLPSRSFRQWTLQTTQSPSCKSRSACKSFTGFIWTIVTVRDRWNLVSGLSISAIDCLHEGDSEATIPFSTELSAVGRISQMSSLEGKVLRTLDWTLPDSCFQTSSHIEWVRNFDWGSTPLGKMRDWSSHLRLAINMVMSDPSPAVLYWGQELTTIYNEAYIPVCRTKHPWALGRSFGDVYSDVENEFGDFPDSVWAHGREQGQATGADERRFVLAMHSEFLEEIFFSYSILPMLESSGQVGGFYTAFRDVTRAVVAARRGSTLQAVVDARGDGTDPEAFWRKLVDAVSSNGNDSVAAFAYSARGTRVGASSMSTETTKTTVLEAFSGVPTDTRGVPCAHDMLRKNVALIAAFDEALKTGLPQRCEIDDLILAQNLLHPTQPLNDRNIPKEIAFCATDPQLPSQGLLAIALNPLRPYDVDYEHFLATMTREISASLATFDRARFAEQAIIESELRFSQMTATSPAAHFEVNLEGQILYVNDKWHDITGMPRAGHEIPAMSWLHMVYEPDLPVIEAEWSNLQAGKSVSFEIRMKKEWQATNPFGGETLDLEYTWVLAMASQHTTKNGPTIMGCLIDINRQKWAEDFHKRKTEEAIQMKQQQERFIDMTSHEMRNPLSAIFQCSDSIVSLLEYAMQIRGKGDSDRKSSEANEMALLDSIKSCIEAAQTISLCAQHQKRIVDDVLVLSKMDANMIEITPLETNPQKLLKSGLGIFASELRANDTQMEFRVEESYEKLGVEWVRLDPSRLLQVLINLTTNALKFTISESKVRRIIVSLGASSTPPSYLSSNRSGFTYLPCSGDTVDPTSRPEWGSGDPVYIHLSVEDTGRGISEAEMKQLFMRFQQASPRTHVEYGGSGLGLHIARQLTELQGGQIGVTSERGKGSTFSFYVKGRRCNPADTRLLGSGAATVNFSRQLGSSITTLPVIQPPQPCEISTESLSVQGSQKLNILVVEDNLVNQKVLSQQLHRLGWHVSVANHGLEALEYLKQTVFYDNLCATEHRTPLDLVLMDIEMPIMDGLTATRKIRQLQAEGTITGHVPIIAVSANARAEQIVKATAAGMDDVVSKPFRIPQLVRQIEQLLAKG